LVAGLSGGMVMRVTACFVMGIGLLTLAVVTAQVASSFVAQGTGKAQPGPQAEPAAVVTLAELDRRLAGSKRSSPPPPHRHHSDRPEHPSRTRGATRPDPPGDRRRLPALAGEAGAAALGGGTRPARLRPRHPDRVLAEAARHFSARRAAGKPRPS